MNSLTITVFQPQLLEADQKLENLYRQIAEVKALKRAIATKERMANKAFSKLEEAVSSIFSVAQELGEEGKELQKAAAAVVSKLIPQQQESRTSQASGETPDGVSSPSKLVTFSRKKNDSNEFFSWQFTSNNQVSNYFNVSSGKVQATYIGGNNKQKLQTVGNKLTEYLEGVSFEVRKAQRLNYKYELKIRGLNDDDIGWLTQFDFNQSFTAQLFNDLGDCPIDSLKSQSVPVNLHFRREEIPTDYRIETDNWLAASGAVVVERATGAKYHLNSIDLNFLIGEVKGNDGKLMTVYLDLYQIEREFADSANSITRSMLACRTKKELDLLRTNNLVDQACLDWCYHNLPKEQKAQIRAISKVKVA